MEAPRPVNELAHWMRIQLFSIIISFALAGCSQSRNSETSAEIAIKDLNLNTPVHGSLTDQQLKEIKRIHHAFAEVSSSSLEEFIDGFKRDQNPGREIAVWLAMADAYERFTLNKHVEEHDKKQEAYDVILLRSMMTEEEVMKKINFTYLSGDEVHEIFSYCIALPQAVTVKKR
jgi:hypothetical protein